MLSKRTVTLKLSLNRGLRAVLSGSRSHKSNCRKLVFQQLLVLNEGCIEGESVHELGGVLAAVLDFDEDVALEHHTLRELAVHVGVRVALKLWQIVMILTTIEHADLASLIV